MTKSKSNIELQHLYVSLLRDKLQKRFKNVMKREMSELEIQHKVDYCKWYCIVKDYYGL